MKADVERDLGTELYGLYDVIEYREVEGEPDIIAISVRFALFNTSSIDEGLNNDMQPLPDSNIKSTTFTKLHRYRRTRCLFEAALSRRQTQHDHGMGSKTDKTDCRIKYLNVFLFRGR